MYSFYSFYVCISSSWFFRFLLYNRWGRTKAMVGVPVHSPSSLYQERSVTDVRRTRPTLWNGGPEWNKGDDSETTFLLMLDLFTFFPVFLEGSLCIWTCVHLDPNGKPKRWMNDTLKPDEWFGETRRWRSTMLLCALLWLGNYNNDMNLFFYSQFPTCLTDCGIFMNSLLWTWSRKW